MGSDDEDTDWFRKAAHRIYIDHLKADFGAIRKPSPNDFGLRDEEFPAARVAYEWNKWAKAFNVTQETKRRALALAVPILGAIVGKLRYPNRAMNSLGIRYGRFLEKLKAYEEILADDKNEKVVERAKKEAAREAAYWFSLSGHKFEEEIADLFRIRFVSSSVVKTKGSGDGGVDLIITDADETKTFVQCKAHKRPMGPHVVRDLYGAMQSAGVTKGLLISLGGVTLGVRDFIRGKEISIFDVNDIIKMHKQVLADAMQR